MHSANQIHLRKAYSHLSLVEDEAPICLQEEKSKLLRVGFKIFYNITIWKGFPIILCSSQTGPLIVP